MLLQSPTDPGCRRYLIRARTGALRRMLVPLLRRIVDKSRRRVQNSVLLNTIASAKIIELRQVLETRFPQESFRPGALLSTGVPVLDNALGGGLVPGAITQLVSSLPSSGTALLLHHLILGMQATSQFVGLVDGKNGFEPFEQMPLLLWIRCQNTSQALKATDLLLRDGNLALIILDLKQNSDTHKIPGPTWYRLQRLAEQSRTAFVVLSHQRTVTNAGATIQLNNTLSFADLSSCSEQIITHISFRCYNRGFTPEKQYASA